jgi:hypothetical protein
MRGTKATVRAGLLGPPRMPQRRGDEHATGGGQLLDSRGASLGPVAWLGELVGHSRMLAKAR